MESRAKRFIVTKREYSLIFKDGWCLPRSEIAPAKATGELRESEFAPRHKKGGRFSGPRQIKLPSRFYSVRETVTQRARSNKLGLDFRPLEHPFFCPRGFPRKEEWKSFEFPTIGSTMHVPQYGTWWVSMMPNIFSTAYRENGSKASEGRCTSLDINTALPLQPLSRYNVVGARLTGAQGDEGGWLAGSNHRAPAYSWVLSARGLNQYTASVLPSCMQVCNLCMHVFTTTGPFLYVPETHISGEKIHI